MSEPTNAAPAAPEPFKPIFHNDVFTAGAEMVVNTTNRVGVMGAGIALAFKLACPNYFRQYKTLCDSRTYPQAGSFQIYQPVYQFTSAYDGSITKAMAGDLIVKNDWRMQSSLTWTLAAIKDMTKKILDMPSYARPSSIATPIPGAVNGARGSRNPEGPPPTLQQAQEALEAEAAILKTKGIDLIICHPSFPTRSR